MIELEDFCNTIQQDLNDLAGSNYAALKREQTGFLSAVLSQQNRSGFSQEYGVDGGDGKQKTVIIDWIQPASLADSSSVNNADICAAGTEVPTLRDTRALTAFSRSEVLMFTKAELRKLCKAPSEQRAMVVASRMNSVFRRINNTLITKYLAGVGGFYNGVAAGKDVELIDATHPIKAVNPNGEFDIMEDFQDVGAEGRPIMVGHGLLSRYVRLAGIGCCNDYGMDVGKSASSFDFFRDHFVDGIAGDPNQILAWAPGAVQMANYVENRGEFAVVHDHFAETSIVDPVTGLELDWQWRYDQCTRRWTMVFYSFYDLFMLPLTMFKDTDERDGVNYAFQYTATEATA